MALQVWLPLTQDTRNQGLCGGNITTSGIAFTDGGKLGVKYLSAGTITIPASTCKKFFNKNHMSFAFWLYPIGTSSSAIIMGQNAMSAGNNRMYSIFQYSTPNDLHLSWQDETSSTTFLGSVDTGFFVADTWTHCCITYNGSVATVYRNGVLYSTHNGTSNRAAFEYDYPITGSTLRKLQDVRIYDHCLSPTEVKELAKGLILHYPLNRQGLGQDNNIAIAKVVNRGCTNFTYNSTTEEWTMTCPTGSSTWGYGITISDNTIKWKTGETWIVSMDVYTPRAIAWQRDINNKPDLEDISEYTGNDYDITGQRPAYTNGASGQTLQVGWNHIWFSQTAPTTYGLTNYSTNWGVVTTNESSAIDIKIKNIKGEIAGVEALIQPTAWIPYGETYKVEYDCSGFGNNGSHANVTYSPNTPKYSFSTVFNDNTDSVKIKPLFANGQTVNELSVACWFKTNTLNSTAPNIFSLGSNSFCRARIASATSVWWYTRVVSTSAGATKSCKTLTDDVWHHMVFTFKNGVETMYIDGASIGTNDRTATGTYLTCNDITENDWVLAGYSSASERFLGSLSDFRIYATALSATDVLSLYQNNAYIDSNNTIHGKIRI